MLPILLSNQAAVRKAAGAPLYCLMINNYGYYLYTGPISMPQDSATRVCLEL